jgi:hypothetical protein
MKYTFSLSGDIYEDRQELNIMLTTPDILNAIHEVRQKIRERLKYEEDISESEEKFLEELMSDLFFEQLQ